MGFIIDFLDERMYRAEPNRTQKMMKDYRSFPHTITTGCDVEKETLVFAHTLPLISLPYCFRCTHHRCSNGLRSIQDGRSEEKSSHNKNIRSCYFLFWVGGYHAPPSHHVMLTRCVISVINMMDSVDRRPLLLTHRHYVDRYRCSFAISLSIELLGLELVAHRALY